MSKGWTRSERARHLRDRTYKNREKIIAIGLLLLTMALELYGIYHVLANRLDPTLAVILIIALILTIGIGVFFLDTFFYESY